MPNISAYGKYQSISLEAEAAYEELYIRLARWTSEAIALQREGNRGEAESKLDRCVEILGYMDRGIDMSQNHDIALGVMSLHRFAITTLVKAKGEGGLARARAFGEGVLFPCRYFRRDPLRPPQPSNLSEFPSRCVIGVFKKSRTHFAEPVRKTEDKFFPQVPFLAVSPGVRVVSIKLGGTVAVTKKYSFLRSLESAI